MRTRISALAAAMALGALVTPASAQIIATSIPKEMATGSKAAEKKFAFHVMGAPLAKWKYGEVYNGNIDAGTYGLGTVTATPNSKFLFAAEASFKAGEDWSVGLGGWYNKVGKTTYGFDGNIGDRPLPPTIVLGLTADFGGDLSIYEGHANLFYKDVGVQGGIVKTTGTIGTTATIKTVTFDGQTTNCSTSGSGGCSLRIPTFKGDTTDWDAFAVYKHSWSGKNAVGLSLGAGVYGKQGVKDVNQPLRGSEKQTVFSGFATLNIEVYKGLGLDASLWYVDKTKVTTGSGKLPGKGNDSQSRFTVGLGYTFSQ